MASWNRGKSAGLDWLHAHVDHRGDDCLAWPFATKRGYGSFQVNRTHYYAHRFMCELAHGAPPTPEHQAAHSCGRGHEGCVNPRHLSWKDQAGNQQDRRQHGTANRGLGWRGKLTWQQTEQIRALGATKIHDEIASQFGISRRNVGAILDGRSRNHEIQTEERRKVMAALERAGRPLRLREIVSAAAAPTESAASSLLTKLVRDGYARRLERGVYESILRDR